ncbi:MAG: hypothetical protein ACPGWR_29480, partial [Ardenticatenaceae bacterium]
IHSKGGQMLMTNDNHLSKDNPRYQARLQAQHGLVLSLATWPLGIAIGIFCALPFAQAMEGFPLAIMPAGISTVLICLGTGLYLLALVQGVLNLAEGFWNLRHSLQEISAEERVIWQTALTGLLIVGIGMGFCIAFLIM